VRGAQQVLQGGRTSKLSKERVIAPLDVMARVEEAQQAEAAKRQQLVARAAAS
jgi:hypothetical protein